MKLPLIFAGALIVIAALLFFPQPETNRVIFHTQNEAVIQVETAITPEQHRQGLMERESLGRGEGMLFLFVQEQDLSFWMKNTLIPLDIIFLSGEKEVVGIIEADPCEADPCPFLSPGVPAQYVIEINQGLSKEWGIVPGTQAEFLLESI